MKRCYGIDKKIIDCDWDYLSQRHTLRAPHESMPRLIDLLIYLAKPGLQHIWLLLDIKVPSLASSPSMQPVLTAPKAHQQRRRYHAPHRYCHCLSRALLLYPLESAHRSWHLGRKVPPLLRATPAWLRNLEHRLLDSLCARVPHPASYLLQHVAAFAHGPSRPVVHPRPPGEREAAVSVDRERRLLYAMEY